MTWEIYEMFFKSKEFVLTFQPENIYDFKELKKDQEEEDSKEWEDENV